MIADPLLGRGSIGRRILIHGLSSPCLAQFAERWQSGRQKGQHARQGNRPVTARSGPPAARRVPAQSLSWPRCSFQSPPLALQQIAVRQPAQVASARNGLVSRPDAAAEGSYHAGVFLIRDERLQWATSSPFWLKARWAKMTMPSPGRDLLSRISTTSDLDPHGIAVEQRLGSAPRPSRGWRPQCPARCRRPRCPPSGKA